MCYCTPTIRTPWCGKTTCQPPHAAHCQCTACKVGRVYPVAETGQGTTVTLKPPKRYLLAIEDKVGGHYGEEQWQETAMTEHEDGDWVRWVDVKAMILNAS